ncbi:inositol monophosphatase family protein [Klugiella xanthotipulae]|uniref:Inositol-1-monophosphatase n=1 Tax=Klugiella xanthotipulae TaxID=244735 RepID=A0A543I4H4_9MICO|nr:inositol monophosphatase family protein [Klugiella xanthotipulae]TQM65498.1 myo-inositol-1(or 4)-monophosphatase [Klugiella xanthotipulae]
MNTTPDFSATPDGGFSAGPFSPDELLRVAHTAARAGAELAHRMRREGVHIAAAKSSIVDVVTDADRAAETLIIGIIVAERPRDSILGEEGGESVTGDSGITWLVDPIDGTVNYLYNIPAYAVSVAAAVRDPRGPDGWYPLAGCVINPSTGEVFTATRGGGAFRNDHPLRVNPAESLDRALVGTGFGYTAEKRRAQGEVVARLLPAVRDIRRLGSAALDLCGVAAGTLDAYYESGLNPWDYGAGVLIAAEAGAVVLGRTGDGQPGTDFLLAAGSAIAEPLRSIVT